MTVSKRSTFLSPLLSLSLPFGLLLAACLLAVPSAWAYHPEPAEMAVVKEVAHELEDAARHVHRKAERNEHHYDRQERKALLALHELEEAADHFHHQVERYRQNPYHTESDYRRLESAYENAYRCLFGLHAFRSVEQSFYRVERLMDDLRYYYTERRGRHGYDRDHGSYGEYRNHGRYRRHGEYRRYGRYDRHGRHDRHDRHDRYDRHDRRRHHRDHRGPHTHDCGWDGPLFSIRLRLP